MSLFPSPPIVCPRGGDKHFSHTGGDKHFHIEGGGTNIFTLRGGQTFYVWGGGAYDDVHEEMDVSEANFLVSVANIFMSEASKLSAGAIILGPVGPWNSNIQNNLQILTEIVKKFNYSVYHISHLWIFVLNNEAH